MDKRQARREAYWRAAQTVRSALAGGWPAEHYPDEGEYEAVSAALERLVGDLERYSVPPDQRVR